MIYQYTPLLIIISVSLFAMEDQKKTYELDLGTSFYEDYSTIPDKDGRNIPIPVFISSLADNDKKSLLSVMLIKKVVEKLPPTIYNEVVSKVPNNTIEDQIRITEGIIKYLSIQLDNVPLSDKAHYQKQITYLQQQKEKIVKCAQCTSVCTVFWFVCTALVTYCFALSSTT